MELFGQSMKYFAQAKSMYESLLAGDFPPAPGMPTELPDINTLLKISKTNFVVMSLMMGGHKADAKAKPVWDFSQHKIHPIIKV